ncbi:MAG: serine hydrolase [Xanthomonadales bacterium]|nr:serine hydrolase [Xanthomonadales bacterium]
MTTRFPAALAALMGCAVLAAAPGPAGEGFDTGPLETLDQQVIDKEFPQTTSVLVSRNGSLVSEQYFKDGGPGILNDTRSAMKSVTALAVGIALADGTLESEDQAAFGWLENHEPFAHDGPAKQAITLADFLTMSSALDCNDWDMSNPGNEENMYPLDDWSRWAVDIPVDPEYERDARGRGRFSYCTAGVFLLGQILKAASGEPLDDWFASRLFRPLGIEAWEWPRSPTGEIMTGGGLRLRSLDLLKLGQLLLANGRWEDQQVVPAEWISHALTVVHRVDEQQSYGYLFWSRNYATPCGPREAWYMSGNGGNVVAVIPSEDMVIVVTRRHYGQRGMHQQTAQLIEAHVLAGLNCG